MPPHITIRITTNLKTKNTKNCQKIKLYGGPTTKDLKKPHLSRQIGGAETGNHVSKDTVWLERAVPHSHVVDKIGRDILGAGDPSPRSDGAAQGSTARKIKPHNF